MKGFSWPWTYIDSYIDFSPDYVALLRFLACFSALFLFTAQLLFGSVTALIHPIFSRQLFSATELR